MHDYKFGKDDYDGHYIVNSFVLLSIEMHRNQVVNVNGRIYRAPWSLGIKIQIEYIPNLNKYDFFLNV